MTKEYFTLNDIIENEKERFGLSDWEQVKFDLNVAKSTEPFGKINVINFIENACAISNASFPNLLDEVTELKNEYELATGIDSEYYIFPGDWEKIDSDNTYNYDGNLSNNLEFTTYKNNETEELLVLVAVHVGLDIRAGYTNSFPILFDNEILFDVWISEKYTLTEIGTETGDDVNILGSAISEIVEFYYKEEFFEAYLNLYDEETARKSVTEFIKKNI